MAAKHVGNNAISVSYIATDVASDEVIGLKVFVGMDVVSALLRTGNSSITGVLVAAGVLVGLGEAARVGVLGIEVEDAVIVTLGMATVADGSAGAT